MEEKRNRYTTRSIANLICQKYIYASSNTNIIIYSLRTFVVISVHTFIQILQCVTQTYSYKSHILRIIHSLKYLHNTFIPIHTDIQVQGVHKVSSQFQKFIIKANEKTDKWKLLRNETYIFKLFLPHSILITNAIDEGMLQRIW